jgi:pyruvate carboxylase
VRYITQSKAHEDGTRTVFFELNGHIGAPMPGTVASINVALGQRVARGDVVTTLEAMKMEAAVGAEIDGEVAEVLMQPAMQVDAKDAGGVALSQRDQ